MSLSTLLIPPTINLPAPLIIHACGLLSTGIYLILRPSNPPSRYDPNPLQIPPNNPRAHEISVLFGLLAAAQGTGYLITSYIPLHQNQFIYGSIPIRLMVAGASLLIALPSGIRKEERGDGERTSEGKGERTNHGKETKQPAVTGGMTKEAYWTLIGVGIFDGLGATVLGLWLGESSFRGRIPGC